MLGESREYQQQFSVADILARGGGTTAAFVSGVVFEDRIYWNFGRQIHELRQKIKRGQARILGRN